MATGTFVASMNKPLLGIFGGTFDPIHCGHINALEQICQSINFAQLRWIPSAKPPHKDSVGATIDQRLEMLELALEGYSNWYVDDLETRRDTPSYTFDTLSQLQSQFVDHQLVMIIGADSLQNLNTWYRYPDLLELAHWVVMHRPNYTLKVPKQLVSKVVDSPEQLEASFESCIWLHHSSEFDISSTEIRAALRAANADQRQLVNLPLITALEDIKGQDINVIDIADISDFADYMVVASGTSDTHVKALAREASDRLRKQEVKPLNEDGADIGEWVLVDFGDVVLHVMRPEVRAYYDLEKLWDEDVRALVKEHREQQGD